MDSYKFSLSPLSPMPFSPAFKQVQDSFTTIINHFWLVFLPLPPLTLSSLSLHLLSHLLKFYMVWVPQKQLRDVDSRVWFPEAEGGVQKTVPEGSKVHTENIIQLQM